MNKLQGFYELQKSGLPAAPWKKYTKDTILEESYLWTVRSAVKSGDDLNLPRIVGADSQTAKQFADQLLEEMGSNNLIVYYPFFIAEKSGVTEVKDSGVVIEAVKGDLWNLVSENKLDISLRITEEDYIVEGDECFLNQEELLQLIDYAKLIRNKYTALFARGESVFLEWSYAYKSDRKKKPVGDRHLVFYELRSIGGR